MLDKAEELGRAIGQTNEYQALRRAQEVLEGAEGLADQIRRLQELAATLERHAVEGKDPPEDAVNEYDRLMGEVQAHAGYQSLVAAQSNFDKMMVRVHERMAEGMRQGGQSSIITLG